MHEMDDILEQLILLFFCKNMKEKQACVRFLKNINLNPEEDADKLLRSLEKLRLHINPDDNSLSEDEFEKIPRIFDLQSSSNDDNILPINSNLLSYEYQQITETISCCVELISENKFEEMVFDKLLKNLEDYYSINLLFSFVALHALLYFLFKKKYFESESSNLNQKS
jgi:hypothetical protein